METNTFPENKSMKIPIKSVPIWPSLFKSNCSVVIVKNEENRNCVISQLLSQHLSNGGILKMHFS